MKKTSSRRKLSCILCTVLIAASALIATGCTDSSTPSPQAETSAAETAAPIVVGEGQTSFSFSVTDADGNETAFIVNTDKSVVGEALIDNGLIEGEDSQYGLFVKKVNGITADFDVDGTYWAFYINGEYAMTGVDATEITEGDTYSFKVEK